MGGGSSKAESAYKETQLSEFAAQYKNADMPQLRLCVNHYDCMNFGHVITNTSDMPAVLDTIVNMCASMQMPVELKDKSGVAAYKTQAIGPFSQQVIKFGKEVKGQQGIWKVALSDALEPLGWKYSGAQGDEMTFTKVGVGGS
jgi:hypothetical protein